ncbi:MAG: DnaJ domain-containing protein [Clostridia bacterium]|nr:DnaJ domain-containing protein [Clostridia bacterium]
MTDPYKILGVNRTDDDETIKQAYRELVRKYHPDKYANTDLAEMATEKMKEVNAAYEQIQEERKRGTSNESQTGGSYGYWQQNQSYSGDSAYAADYARIRSHINSGNLDDAQTLLRNMPENGRGAEWHFLMGCVLLRRGHVVDAQNHLDRACRLDPYNSEYRTVANRLRTQTAAAAGGYRTTTSAGGCSECDICSSLLCADCCCECMGGDLISCC